jgi:Holliday junction resolvase RusA-like endonuclease
MGGTWDGNKGDLSLCPCGTKAGTKRKKSLFVPGTDKKEENPYLSQGQTKRRKIPICPRDRQTYYYVIAECPCPCPVTGGTVVVGQHAHDILSPACDKGEKFFIVARKDVDNLEVKFFLPMRPPTVTHQEKAVRVVGGKPVFYEKPELKAARAKLLDALAQHRPSTPMTGAVRLVVTWCFPLDDGGRHRDGEPKTSKPDTDNLQKLFKDCMTKAGFWVDDAQVYMEQVGKFWAATPGIFVHAIELQRLKTKEAEERI